MARDHARIRLDIWADEDWRDLPALPQWLYLHLLSSPTLNFCGVTDWRPARIAALAADLTAADVEYAAAWLEEGEFIVVDRDTEEALVRSWVKHDGIMASPNMAKALAKAHAAIGSGVLRAVVIGQLERLKQTSPKLPGWKHVGDLMRKRSLTPSEAFQMLPRNPSLKGSGNPSPNPSDDPSGNPSEIRPELHTPFSVLHTPPSDLSPHEDLHLTRAIENYRQRHTDPAGEAS
jgi:hypothetical protein